jgi:hypothetical protein
LAPWSVFFRLVAWLSGHFRLIRPVSRLERKVGRAASPTALKNGYLDCFGVGQALLSNPNLLNRHRFRRRISVSHNLEKLLLRLSASGINLRHSKTRHPFAL